MKRGLISWDRHELPAAAFDARLSALDQLCADFDVPALVAYSDVCRSNDVRYISNYMPYWNRAFTVVPRGEKPILLCALSPRVYPWIKSVTVHETILPSPSLPAQLVKLSAEKGWTKLGVIDQAGLPNDLYTQLSAEKLSCVDIPRGAFRPVATESELAMHRRAAVMAREILAAEVTRSAIGLTDYELAGRLERRFRRAGAEDLVVLISAGRGAPLPAAGHKINENSSVTVALEYNGHWVKLSRNTDNVSVTLPPPQDSSVHRELLSGRYPWEGINSQDDSRNVITSIQVMIQRGENRLYYGDTGIQGTGRLADAMNVVEKILAKRSGKAAVEPDDVVITGVDVMLMHDLSANFVMKVFENEMQGAHIANPDKLVFAFDHNFSPATRDAAEALAAVRKFAARHKIRHLFDSGCGSIHHVIMEAGLAAPGMIIVGCDSHTPMYGALGAFATGIGNNSMAALGFVHESGWFKVPHTIKVHFHGAMGPGVMARDVSQYMIGRLGEDGAIYKAIEYAGPYIEGLSVIDRCLFPLQAIDVGGKCGYINPDEKTVEYVRSLPGPQNFELFRNDDNVRYAEIIDIDVSRIEPQVACPPTVGNVKPIDAAVGTPIDVAEAGGSTGGRLSDIRTLAKCFANAKVHPGVRLQVVPATRGIYLAALREGLFETLYEAGANIFPASAGSNQAFNMGALAADEVMISTQARNFPGRNGHPKARHFLGSALTVAASAINGKITDPRSLI